MTTDNKQFERHSFKSFLEKYQVIIPMVQRDYAQGRDSTEVNRVRDRFLSAIKGYLIQPIDKYKVMEMDFVYGETENIWSKTTPDKLDKIVVTPLDGQQRLTTLFLLHWYAAKKEKNLAPDDYKFLNNFTYDVRPSSRDFCSHLVKFTPIFDSTSIKDQIFDQYWFMADWDNDPTIISMLVMIDAINKKFADVDNLWNLLTGSKERIVFFFLPLHENGLSDELYIKMNSRGKKLTPFEHFKAEYESLYERDSEEYMTISHKFDVEWIDLLFDYRDSNDLTDNEFMRYFFYISHILCYMQGVEPAKDEFELIKNVYTKKENRDFFEKSMDCWCQVKNEFGSVGKFFSTYLSQLDYEKGKVATYKTIQEYHSNQNFFHACIKLYQVNNNFSYSDFLFLFGIITYLMNRDKVEESAFIERLRILRNLIWNSNSGEIRKEYMQDLLTEVSKLMLEGIIDKSVTHGFNGIQENEEIDKIERKKLMTAAEVEVMCKFEDHPLIYGFVSGLGYENLELTDAFYKVFNNDYSHYLDIHLALISIGNYMQSVRTRYYMVNSNRSTWDKWLHGKNRGGFDNSMKVLRELLCRIKKGVTLQSIRDSFTKSQEGKNEYTWQYYFAKYPAMLRGSDGELVWEREDKSDYECISLNRHQFNGQHWKSFLNVIDEKLAQKLNDEYGEEVISLDNYGGNLNILHPISSVDVSANGFTYVIQGNEINWSVEQNNGVDAEDRILLAINKIEGIIKEAFGKK